MEDSQKDTLRKAVDHLKSTGIELDGMIAKLRVKKILTPKQMALLLATDDRSEKLDKFLIYMQRKGQAAFDAFQGWFESTIDRMNYKRYFGTEEEKKEFELSEEEEEEEEDEMSDMDDEDSSENESSQPARKKMKTAFSAKNQPSLKKMKSTCPEEAPFINEVSQKNQKNKGSKGKGKGKKKNTPVETISSEETMILEDSCVEGEDSTWNSIKDDALSIITPKNRNQLYRLHLGRNIFATAGNYQDTFYFHIRRFKGDKLYPSFGIAFTNDNFMKFLQRQDEIELALKHPIVENSLEIQLDDIKLSIVDDKLDIRKLVNLEDKEEGMKQVFSRSGVRIAPWQFKNLQAVNRHLHELIPNWAE